MNNNATLNETVNALKALDYKVKVILGRLNALEEKMKNLMVEKEQPAHKKGYYEVWDGDEKPKEPLIRYWTGEGWEANHMQIKNPGVGLEYWKHNEFIESKES